MRNMVRLTLLTAFFFGACGLGFGDAGYVVYLANRTGQPITVTVEGSADATSRPRNIDVGARVSMTWLYPDRSSDTRRATVRATTADGQLVFCRRYSFDEVRADLKWEVNIVLGTLSC